MDSLCLTFRHTVTHPLGCFIHLANSRGVLPLGCQMTRALYPTGERGTQDRAHSQYPQFSQVGCGTHYQPTHPKDTKVPVASLLPPPFLAPPDLISLPWICLWV